MDSNAGRNNSQDNYAMVGESDSNLQSSDAEDEPQGHAKGSSFRRWHFPIEFKQFNWISIALLVR